MTYTAIINNDSLAHHGVKGMKWGVHKQRPLAWTQRGSLGKRASGGLFKGSMIGYTKTNRKGVEKQKSYKTSYVERAVLKKMGVINKDGSITSDKQKQQARTYCDTMKKVAVASVVIGSAVNLGAQGVNYALNKKYG